MENLPLRPDGRGIRTLSFHALGSPCIVKFRCEDERTALEFAADALGWLGKFEAKFSRFRPDSMVSKINAAAGLGWVETDREMDALLDTADALFFRTKGILDVTTLPLQRVWDWRAAREKLPEGKDISAALGLTGWGKVERRPGAVFLPMKGMGIDFGGFGKELAVDRVADLARRAGITDALVDLGRDVFASGGNGWHDFWHVGIEDAVGGAGCWGGLALSGKAVSTSGDARRFFVHNGVRYSHILDPRTGWPVSNGVRSVTAVADTCLEAGIFSTTIFILGPDEGLKLASLSNGVEACVQLQQGMTGTPGFGQWLVKAA